MIYGGGVGEVGSGEVSTGEVRRQGRVEGTGRSLDVTNSEDERRCSPSDKAGG